MNRAERRRLKKVEKDPILTIKRSDFDKKMQESYQNGYKKATEDAKKVKTDQVTAEVFTMLLGLPMKILKEDYGFGMKKRLPEFADKVISAYMDFDGSSLEDLQNFIYETSGIKFMMED